MMDKKINIVFEKSVFEKSVFEKSVFEKSVFEKSVFETMKNLLKNISYPELIS
jgi:hypothetical protein